MKGGILQGVTAADYERIGRGAGFLNFKELERSSGSSPILGCLAGGMVTIAELSAPNDQNRFRSIALTTVFEGLRSVEVINRWNSEKRFVKGCLAEGLALFQMDLVTISIGEDNVRAYLEIWHDLMVELSRYVKH